MSAISAINASSHELSHSKNLTSSHLERHQDSDHHSNEELLAFEEETLEGSPAHSDADHPDCHSNHCHHSSMIYLDLSSQVHLSNIDDYQVIDKTNSFSSLLLRPDSRPPIV